MAYLIGTDEAGYGPNLGPLIVSASLWEVGDWSPRESLYDRLAGGVTAAPGQGLSEAVALCDSKALYRPGSGLAALERGVQAAMRQCGLAAQSWRTCWRSLAQDSSQPLDDLPWYRDFEMDLPVEAEGRHIESASARLAESMQRSSVRLLAIRSRAVFPQQFNQQTEALGSKGAVLSQCTVGLIAEALSELSGDVFIQCDKHGGRNRYGPCLQTFFPHVLIECHGESRASSIYRWGPKENRVETRFVAKGESFLPSALASMACKYLRELAMLAFNRFWRRQLPDLRPTAGYPLDAKRFKAQIATRQQELGIAEHTLWRQR